MTSRPPRASTAPLGGPTPGSTPRSSVISVAHDTEEGRSFLQARLALFGRVVSLVSISFFTLGKIASIALLPAFGWVRQVSFSELCHLGEVATMALLWLMCRRGRLAMPILMGLDLAAIALISMWHGAMGIAASSELAFKVSLPVGKVILPDTSPILLATISVVLARAVIVPSSARRTLLVTLASGAPMVLATWYIHARWGLRELPFIGLLHTAYVGLWSLSTAAIAAIASGIIYDLHGQVRAAQQLGQYHLDHKIGEGGMGVVYRASDAMLRRPTAIKLLPADRAGERNLARFEREVQLTAQLTHPNTVAIYDFGRTPDGVFYYAMEYVDGLDLEELVRRFGALPAGRVVHILTQVCAALHEAHGMGLIHRDIKPANILLTTRTRDADVVKVVDFGLVKDLGAVNAAPDLSTVDSLVGTPMYVAPEAVRDPTTVDARSDLYAVGCVGYFLLTGRPVFEGASLVEVCGHHLHTVPKRPSARLGRSLPRAVEEAILACLEKDPAKRPRDAHVLAAWLSSIEELEPWTDEEARKWWAQHGEVIRNLRSRAGASPLSQTIAIDLGARVPAPHGNAT